MAMASGLLVTVDGQMLGFFCFCERQGKALKLDAKNDSEAFFLKRWTKRITKKWLFGCLANAVKLSWGRLGHLQPGSLKSHCLSQLFSWAAKQWSVWEAFFVSKFPGKAWVVLHDWQNCSSTANNMINMQNQVFPSLWNGPPQSKAKTSCCTCHCKYTGSVFFLMSFPQEVKHVKTQFWYDWSPKRAT